MKTLKIVQTGWFLTISLLVISGCKPGSIAINGDDCKMNGSFENVKNGYPVNWHYYAPKLLPESDFTITSDSFQFNDGNKSLLFQIKKCESIGGRYSPGFFEEFKVIPGEMYMVSFWVLNKGCTFKVYLSTGMKGIPGITENIIITKETFSDWKYIEYCILIPKTNDNLRFEANILSPGTIWFDDIKIEGVKDKNQMIVYPYRGHAKCKDISDN